MVFRNQLIILFILFAVFFCQKLIQVLSVSVDSNIPVCYALFFVLFSLLEILKLILPFSLFLGLLITLKYLCVSNEITAMYACGLGNNYIFRAACMLSMFTAVCVIINVFWISPLSSCYCSQLLTNMKYYFHTSNVMGGRFYFFNDDRLMFFTHQMDKNQCKNIFIFQLKPDTYEVLSLVTAKTGLINQQIDNTRLFILNQGIYYKGCSSCDRFHYNIYVTDFNTHRVLLHYDKISNQYFSIEQMSMSSLWNANIIKANVELHWRLTLIISVFIMSIISVSLSVNCLRRSYFLDILPGVLLCLFFFLLQISLRFYGISNSCDYIKFLMWLVNILYCVIGLILSFNNFVYIKFRR